MDNKLLPKERDKSIKYIIASADLEPQTFSHFIRQFFKNYGIGFVFVGTSEVLFIVLMLAITIFISPYDSKVGLIKITEQAVFNAFITGPLVYSGLYYLSIWHEIWSGTYEFKMTLKLSLKDLLIARMLVFSMIALVISTLSNLSFWLVLNRQVSFIHLLAVSFSALFLFACIHLIVDYRLNSTVSYFITPSVWLILSGILFWQRVRVTQGLLNLPGFLLGAIACLSVISYSFLLKKKYMTKKEGVLQYVRN